MYSLAVHISDGVLPPTWQAGGFAVAAILLALNVRRLDDDEIPRLALLSAVFFVASLIHVNVGVTSVHLLLNGLVGVVLGWRAILAITVGLVLQAVLIGHGGYTALGVNICNMTLPAYLAWALFEGLRRIPAVRRSWPRGFLVAGAVILWQFSLLVGLELIWTDWHGSTSSASVIDGGFKSWIWHPLTVGGVVIVGVLVAVWERRLENSPDFAIGLLVGEVSVLATVVLTAIVLRLALPEPAGAIAPILFVAHMPIAAIEGVICGFAVSFLLRSRVLSPQSC